MSDEIIGLTDKDVDERIQKYGYNELNEKTQSWAFRLFKRFWGPIPWMIEAAVILSAIAKKWEDFVIITVLLFVNAVVDFYQETKALNAIAVLKKRLARRALVFRNGAWIETDAKMVVPDDIIKIKIGDIVPADVKLLKGDDMLLVDQSALTGESLPVEKNVEDELYANAVIKQGEMIARVTKTGKDTYFGKTVGLVAKAQKEEHSHFQKMVIKVGNFLIFLTIAMIAVIVYHGVKTNESILELLIFALVLTISAIPVAMPAVLTVTMAIGARVLASKDAIVSRLAAIEELAGMDILCSDKTGTLTQNSMSLAQPYTVNEYTQENLMLFAALASKEENSDPIEKPIFEYIKSNKMEDDLLKYKQTKFLPFDPVHKRTQGIYKTGDKEIVITKGAPQVIISQCDEKKFDEKEAFKQIELFASRGFRTLGVAYRNTDEDLYHFVGLISLFDPPREDSKESIEAARAKGVSVKMITGDNIAVAKYIASLLSVGENIEDIHILKGESLEEYLYLSKVLSQAIVKNLNPEESKAQAEQRVSEILKYVQRELYNMPLPKGSILKHESEIISIIEEADGFAQVFPEDKYYIVEKLQKADHIVGMTGDGVNDAPALKKADCGIAVSGATDAARAAADIVLMSPGLRVIIDAIEESRRIFERMKSYAIFRIAETIRIVIFMTLSIVVYDFYPVTALMIIILALLNDIPIMTIAYDNTRVRRKPVRWDMKEIFVLSTWLGVAGVASSFTLFWLLVTKAQLPIDVIQTLFFAKLVIAGHGTIYNTRIDDWFFKRPFPSFKLFTATFASRIAGTLIAVYGFGFMTPIGWKWAAAMWAYALTWFVFNDVIKMGVIKYYRKRYHIEVI
ncbi:plasma-membrane proton-efflux P-type ATPase [Sulfurimonas sp. HSL-1716]|uniref:plasma-membrane proton-efflux P-type ATPase n=1 Tax=Hydrocurvibacter sulfurireducens TaxID=3131937 RepID=UPI0031F84F36